MDQATEERSMRLVKVTDNLYVNPERVIAVEARSVDQGIGSDGERQVMIFTELTLETQTRWRLDMPLDQVVHRLDPTTPQKPVEYR